MSWNWQHKDWPHFSWDKESLKSLESEFLQKSGVQLGTSRHIGDAQKVLLVVDIMTEEALKTSEIEGEYLDRDSLQSSIRRNLGLQTDHRRVQPAERGIAEMMTDLYRNFGRPLSHETLYSWHAMITSGRSGLKKIGKYRTHQTPMQVVSRPVYKPNIHFEAPPSAKVQAEMNAFINWFADTTPGGAKPFPALTRAGLAHLYFVCIHPFEDGNGRIARAIATKALSEGIGELKGTRYYLNIPPVTAAS